MVGPNYQPPENDVSDAWHNSEEKDLLFSMQTPPVLWWECFRDPLLSQYIEIAMKNNNDVLVAKANIAQARGVRQVAASKLFPWLLADANASRSHYSKNGPAFSIGNTSGIQAQVPLLQNLFNGFFDASWELDLFGKTRREVQAASAMVESAIEQKNDVLISVIAEVARNYFEIRKAQKQVELIEKNIMLYEQNAEVIQKGVVSGYNDAIDMQTVVASLEQARSSLPGEIGQVYKGIYALSVLTGNVPEYLLKEMWEQKPLPTTPYEIALGVRSDLLRRRPDVRKAERDLAAATANVGVAVASFFPTITLSADLGLQALKIKNIFQMSSKAWSYGGDIAMPLFQGGKLVGNLKANRAAASAAAATYQKVVLQALQDAETYLTSYKENKLASENLSRSVASQDRIVSLMQQRYEKGLVNVIDLLNSEKEWIASKRNLVEADTSVLLNLVSLYKALGGGWEAEESED